MPILPLSAMSKLIKEAGAQRVSNSAKEKLRKILEDRALEISSEAIKFAKYKGRLTVQDKDIEKALRYLFKSLSPTKNMSDITMAEIGKLKEGRYIVINGSPHIITNMQKSAPGKHGHAKYRVEAKNMFTGNKTVIVMTAHAHIEVPTLKKQKANVLSVSGNSAQIMDMETYETFDLEIPDDLKDAVEAGKIILYWEIMGKRIMKEIVKG